MNGYRFPLEHLTGFDCSWATTEQSECMVEIRGTRSGRDVLPVELTRNKKKTNGGRKGRRRYSAIR